MVAYVSEMVERVARAIYAATIESPPWDQASKSFDALEAKMNAVDQARAAIKAMYDIPSDMYEAYRCDKTWKESNSVEVWNKWIEAALHE